MPPRPTEPLRARGGGHDGFRCSATRASYEDGKGLRLLSGSDQCGHHVVARETCYEGCLGLVILDMTPQGVRQLAAGSAAAVCD